MKTLFTLFVVLLITGCAKKSYYTLGDNLSVKSTTVYKENISVKKIEVPKYLEEFNLVRQTSPYNVEIIDKANWLIPMQKRLTDILIESLQQSMNNPNIHLYPWESSKKDKIRVSVRIKKFIAYKNNVILKADYKIEDLNTNITKSELFKTSVKTDATLDGMMASMEKAYLELVVNIKNNIIK